MEFTCPNCIERFGVSLNELIVGMEALGLAVGEAGSVVDADASSSAAVATAAPSAASSIVSGVAPASGDDAAAQATVGALRSSLLRLEERCLALEASRELMRTRALGAESTVAALRAEVDALRT